MGTNQNTKRVTIFLGFAFGIPWIAALVINLVMAGQLAQAVALANVFFILTPWLANIATRLVTREGWGNLWLRPNFKRSWKAYLAVWLLPLLATLVGGAIFYLIFPGSFDPNLGVVQKLVAGTPSAAANPWLILLSTTLSIVLVSTPINTVVSMGEEFGWRAYLLPKLMKRFASAPERDFGVDLAQAGSFDGAAARKAALLTGLVHGVWHWPLILMSMRLVPEVTFLTPVVYLVFVCSMSVLLSWATLRSGSVWPAALGHGAINAASALPGYLLKGPAIALVGPDPTGLVGGIGYITPGGGAVVRQPRIHTRKRGGLRAGGASPAAM